MRNTAGLITRAVLLMSIMSMTLMAQTEAWAEIETLNDEKQFDAVFSKLEELKADYAGDVEYQWRMARHFFNVSDNTTDDDAIAEALYKGFEYAKQSIASDTESAPAHGYYGILIGRIGEIEGTKQKIINSYDVKEHTLLAIGYDPTKDTYQHVMGQWNYKLSELSWFERTIANLIYAELPDASFEEAEKFFIRAAELAPDEIRHFLWAGKAQLELDKDDLAKKNFEAALALPKKSESDGLLQAEAEELLKKL